MKRYGNDPMRCDFCPTCFVEGGCECVIHQGRFEEIKHLQDESDDCEICFDEDRERALDHAIGQADVRRETGHDAVYA